MTTALADSQPIEASANALQLTLQGLDDRVGNANRDLLALHQQILRNDPDLPNYTADAAYREAQ